MWVYFIRKQRRQQSCPVTASRHSGRVLPKQQPRKAPPGRVEFQESLLWSGCLPSLQKPWLRSGFSIQCRGRKVPAGNYINSASLPPSSPPLCAAMEQGMHAEGAAIAIRISRMEPQLHHEEQCWAPCSVHCNLRACALHIQQCSDTNTQENLKQRPCSG